MCSDVISGLDSANSMYAFLIFFHSVVVSFNKKFILSLFSFLKFLKPSVDTPSAIPFIALTLEVKLPSWALNILTSILNSFPIISAWTSGKSPTSVWISVKTFIPLIFLKLFITHCSKPPLRSFPDLIISLLNAFLAFNILSSFRPSWFHILSFKTNSLNKYSTSNLVKSGYFFLNSLVNSTTSSETASPFFVFKLNTLCAP